MTRKKNPIISDFHAYLKNIERKFVLAFHKESWLSKIIWYVRDCVSYFKQKAFIMWKALLCVVTNEITLSRHHWIGSHIYKYTGPDKEWRPIKFQIYRIVLGIFG